MSAFASDFDFDTPTPALPGICCGCGAPPSAQRLVSLGYHDEAGGLAVARVNAPYCTRCNVKWNAARVSMPARALFAVCVGVASAFVLSMVWPWAPVLVLSLVAPAVALLVELALVGLSRRVVGTAAFPVQLVVASPTSCTVRAHSAPFASAIAQLHGTSGRRAVSWFTPETLAPATVLVSLLVTLGLAIEGTPQVILSNPFSDGTVTWEVEGVGTFDVLPLDVRSVRVGREAITVRARSDGAVFDPVEVPTFFGARQLVDVDARSCFSLSEVVYGGSTAGLRQPRLLRPAPWHDVRGIEHVLRPPPATRYLKEHETRVERVLRYVACGLNREVR